jgi:hypothetical protein
MTLLKKTSFLAFIELPTQLVWSQNAISAARFEVIVIGGTLTCNISQLFFVNLTALGTFIILSPQKAQAASPTPPGAGGNPF